MTLSRPHATAALTAAFLVAVNVPYAMLIERFGYDDILREPAAVVLRTFAAGGPTLVAIWLAFALGCLLFVPVAASIAQALRDEQASRLSPLTLVGVLSALLQAVGLLRWVFVVPVLARIHGDPAASDAAREAALVGFQVVHQYGGVVIGELLGQLLLVAWTLGIARLLLARGGAWTLLGGAGVVIGAAWVVGFTELLGTAMPGIAVIEAAPFAFMAWEAWLAALAAALLWSHQAPGRRAPAATLRADPWTPPPN